MKPIGVRVAIIGVEVMIILCAVVTLYGLHLEMYDRQDTIQRLQLMHQKVLKAKAANANT